MKTKEEIEKLAEDYARTGCTSEENFYEAKESFMDGYLACQEQQSDAVEKTYTQNEWERTIRKAVSLARMPISQNITYQYTTDDITLMIEDILNPQTKK